MVKAKFSSNYWATIKRLQRLPKFTGQMADTITKKDAEGLIEEYKKGIRENSFGLKSLQPDTIKAKMRQGLPKPYTPLYGKGESVKNSLINTFRIKKIKKGHRVYMSWAKHHSAGISLEWLFRIHEEGAVIKRGKSVWRIPPRPTKLKAFKRFIAKKLREENVKRARLGMINYLKTGSTKGLKV